MLPSTSKQNGRNKKRLTRRLSWDDEGVASTIGTIMSLMIFLTFLSMFMNQYVPIWMEDNEASHMNNVEGQFANLKQSIDMQILAGLMGNYEVTLYTPITLGAQGIPMFAAPTMGQLSTNPDQSNTSASISFVYAIDGVNYTINPSSSGNIKLIVPNRYFVPQTIVYENDAIILTQNEGELIKAPPQLNLRKEGTRYNMAFTMISIVSDNQTYNGFDNRGVTTYLRSAVTTTYEDYNVFMNVTDDVCAFWIITIVRCMVFLYEQHDAEIRLYERCGI